MIDSSGLHPEAHPYCVYFITAKRAYETIVLYVGETLYPETRWRRHKAHCHNALVVWNMYKLAREGWALEFEIVDRWSSREESLAGEAAKIDMLVGQGRPPLNYGPWVDAAMAKAREEGFPW